MIKHDGKYFAAVDVPVPVTQSGPLYAVNIEFAVGMCSKLVRYLKDPDKAPDHEHYADQLQLYKGLCDEYFAEHGHPEPAADDTAETDVEGA